MRLFLIRHGAYLSDYSSDSEPALSTLGKAQAIAAGRYLKSQNVCPDIVITSGYLRANETADHILAQINSTCDRTELHDFNPSGDPSTMRAIIESFHAAHDLIVVGHMHAIGELARQLSLQAPSYFDTCTVMAFEYNNHTWKFLWFNDCGRTVS